MAGRKETWLALKFGSNGYIPLLFISSDRDFFSLDKSFEISCFLFHHLILLCYPSSVCRHNEGKPVKAKCCLISLLNSTVSPVLRPAPAWGPSHRRQSFMSTSNVGPFSQDAVLQELLQHGSFPRGAVEFWNFLSISGTA